MRLLNKKQTPPKHPNQKIRGYKVMRRQQAPLLERNGIIGTLLVLLWLSVVYSSLAVWFNIATDGLVPKILLAPQIVAAGALLVWKFTKK